MNNQKISIIVNLFNRVQNLVKALQCVSYQTLTGWECVILNDASTNDNDTIAQKRCNMNSRFKYILKENVGLNITRNAGLEISL
jgi:glycosyltransferase involved in cell wall biosynthesis